MKIKVLLFSVLALTMMIPVLSIAGNYHGYHGGHGYGLKSWNMDDLDTDNDGFVTFEEFAAPSMETWRSGFDSVDQNGDQLIDGREWNSLREMHGVPSE